MTSYHLGASAVVTDEVATVELTGPNNDGAPAVSTGWAKKHPMDAPNKEIGFNLAMARALANLSEVYAERAAEQVQGAVEVGGYVYEPEKTGDWVTDTLASLWASFNQPLTTSPTGRLITKAGLKSLSAQYADSSFHDGYLGAYTQGLSTTKGNNQ